MDLARQKRKDKIQKRLSFLKSSLLYPEPKGHEACLTQLVCNLMEEGNLSFKEGEWDQAIKDFTEGVNLAQNAQAEDLCIPPALLESLYVNRASAFLRMAEYELGIQDCDSALAVCEGSSSRALYRKALCLKEMGLYREAYNCSTRCLLNAPKDKKVNELAQELANRLGIRVHKAYVSSKILSNGMDSLRDITPSSTQPVDFPGQGPQGPSHSEPEALGDLDVIGDDLDSLLDCFPNEPEAQGTFPTDHSSFTPSPGQNLIHSGLPAPSPQLPPAFFTSAVSQLNSLDTFYPPREDPNTALDALDSLDGLDALDDFSIHGGGDSGGALKPALNATDKIESLDALDNLAPLRASEAGAPSQAAAVDELDTLDLEGLDFLDTLESIPALGDGDAPEKALYPLDSLDCLDSLDTFSPLEGVARTTSILKPVGEGRLGSVSNFIVSGGGRSLSAPPASRSTKSCHTNNHRSSVISKLYQNPLASTHMFLQACTTCYTHKAIYDVHHQPDLVHNCRRDLLLCRNRAESVWMRVRPMPTRNQFHGPYVLCNEVQQKGSCKFGEACTFAFYQQEIDVWTQERKGTLNRDLLFNTVVASHGSILTVMRLLQLHSGMFMFLCKECYDSKPRIISMRSKQVQAICSNLSARHHFDNNKCLVHVARSSCVRSSVSYSKIRPLSTLCQYDVCRHAIRYGCQREDSCQFAHSVIELKCWMLQRDTGITPEDIVVESTKHCQKLEQQAQKQRVKKPMNMPPSRATGGGGGAGRKGRGRGLNMRMKFVCAQCWRDGLASEPDKALKYCTAKARHSWTKERRVLLVMSLEKKKWVIVRSLPYAKNYPQQYDICSHIAKQRKCTFTGNCSYAHSEEEKEVWTFMKNHNLKDMQQMYDMWLSLTNQSRQPDSALLTQTPNPSEEKYIEMPTDFAEQMDGFHCRLCGRHSNSERQWQQHISSEKHKDRVFSCEGEDESLAWTYRFPGLRIARCPRLESGCLDGASCDYAHSEEELVEWKERRDFLRRKLAKAREDMLIMPDEFEFGKYSFLLQD